VLGFVLAAFFAASLADFRAQGANGFCMIAAACHCGRGKLAGGRAVDVKRDAPGHHCDIGFFQA